MSLNYTVTKIEDFEGPEGKCRVRIDHIGTEFNENIGNYIEVKVGIHLPIEYEGRTHKETFMIEHPNELTRKIAIRRFNIFSQNIGGAKEGDTVNEKIFLYKMADVNIVKSLGKAGTKNEGKNFYNIESWQPADSNFVQGTPSTGPNPALTALIEKETGIVIPQTPVASGVILNDEVPF